MAHGEFSDTTSEPWSCQWFESRAPTSGTTRSKCEPTPVMTRNFLKHQEDSGSVGSKTETKINRFQRSHACSTYPLFHVFLHQKKTRLGHFLAGVSLFFWWFWIARVILVSLAGLLMSVLSMVIILIALCYVFCLGLVWSRGWLLDPGTPGPGVFVRVWLFWQLNGTQIATNTWFRV